MADQLPSPTPTEGAPAPRKPLGLLPARGLEGIASALETEVDRRLAERRAAGKDVLNLSVVEPELPPPDIVTRHLCQAAEGAPSIRGAGGLPEYRATIARWYQSRFKTSIDPGREVVPLPSIESGVLGLAHALLNPNDLVLVPDPARPVYHAALSMVGARVVDLPLRPEQDFLPELKALPAEVAAEARMLLLDYPNDPTGAVAPAGFFHQVVQFAREHDVLVVHVANYSEYAYDGYRAISLLEIPQSRQVCVELHSVAHTLNLPGWPVAFAAGNADALRLLRSYRAHLDGLTFVPAQRAVAETLLDVGADWLNHRNAIYQTRRDKAITVLEALGLHARRPKAVPAIWAAVPAGYTSLELADALLDQTGVWVAPGSLYGSRGEGFIRLSLTLEEGRFQDAMQRLSKATVPPRGVVGPTVADETEAPVEPPAPGEERENAG